MKTVRSVISKIFAIQFYRNNATLFLLVIVFAGGFMRSYDHIALASYFMSSSYLLLAPVVVWIIYALLIISFVSKAVKSSENSFLSNFTLFDFRTQYSVITPATTLFLLPVFAYGVLLLLVGLKENQWATMGCVIAAIATLAIILAILLRKKIIQPDYRLVPYNGFAFSRPWSKNIVLISLEGGMRQAFLPIAGFKSFGLLLLIAVVAICKADTYDIRMPAIFVLASFALNIAFILQHHEFLNRKLTCYRLMPYTLLSRYLHTVAVLTAFSLGEIILLIRNLTTLFLAHELLALILLGISLNILFASFLYTRDRKPENSMAIIYILTISIFFAILSGVPIWLLGIIFIAASYSLFSAYYYRFEYLSES